MSLGSLQDLNCLLSAFSLSLNRQGTNGLFRSTNCDSWASPRESGVVETFRQCQLLSSIQRDSAEVDDILVRIRRGREVLGLLQTLKFVTLSDCAVRAYLSSSRT